MRYTVSGVIQITVNAATIEEAWAKANERGESLERRYPTVIVSLEEDTVDRPDRALGEEI